MDESMSNSIVIMFKASEFDGTGEVCSISANCDCVSNKKFVVNYPSSKRCRSFLKNVIANQMSSSFLNQIFDEYLPIEIKKVKIQIHSLLAFTCRYEDRNKSIIISPR